MNLDNLDDAEKFQKHFVQPMIDAMRTEIAPLAQAAARIDAIDQRVTKLETMAKKLATVYSGIIAVATYLVHYGWAKVQHKFFS